MTTRYYVDTSIALLALTSNSAARSWFDEATATGSLSSSRLLKTELTRVLRRKGLPVALRSRILDYVSVVPMTEQVLVLAEAISQHVKTLDAIHLASALQLGEATVVSHDAKMLTVATDLGLETLDPFG